MLKKFLVYFALCGTLGLIQAAPIQLPYYCDFEDDSENAQWMLNANPRQDIATFKNLWYIAGATFSNGAQSLYISSDGGQTASYTSTENTVISYREFEITAGTYDFAFDWKASGASAALYVALVPAAEPINSYNNVPDLPMWLDIYKINGSGTGGAFSGSTQWRHEQTQLNVPADGTYRLVFVWNNSRGAGKPGGAIDNVQISNSLCAKPYELSVQRDNNTVLMTWKGDGRSYNLRYQRQQDTMLQEIRDIKDNWIEIAGLANGVYDFWLQSICDDGQSSIWVCFPSVLIYEALCIDFLNLDSAVCSTGKASPTSFDYSSVQVGKVDYGFGSQDSRHTVHYQKDEYDPQTNFGLKTIPDGEIASVRLGNWKTGGDAERISYEYTVDATKAAVLLLKYAIVIECPQNHDISEQPRFLLEMFGTDGNKLDACTQADFSAQLELVGTEGWHQEGDDTRAVLWKEWTTVGINLKDYDGQTITIQLTSFDCSKSGHYGYAYFTLGCDKGVVEGIMCGDYPTTQFIAPEGFNYSWRKKYEASGELSTAQVFDVDPNDTTTYEVDVIYPTMEQCYFTLEASAIPRYPVAEFSYTVNQHDCRNEVVFHNTSYILTKDPVSQIISRSDKPVEEVQWDLGNGTTSQLYEPTVVYPDEGGKFVVTLHAKLCGGMCAHDTTLTIEVPPIGEKTTVREVSICENDSYDFFGRNLNETGLYYDTLSTTVGCDSIICLDLRVSSVVENEVKDTACADRPYVFGDKELTKGGRYVHTFVSSAGCDSVVTLDLMLLEPLRLEVGEVGHICAKDPDFDVPYTLLGGSCQDYSVEFNAHAIQAGFQNRQQVRNVSGNCFTIPLPADVKPDKGYSMTLVLADGCGGEIREEIPFSVYYPSDIMVQKWDDVIALLNSNYNGGYEFTAYQWYKDGQPMAGAVEPNLYEQGGLDVDAEYSLLLTRSGDGIQLFTCPLQVQSMTVPTALPARAAPSETVSLTADENGTYGLWDMMGMSRSGGQLLKDRPVLLTMPAQEGIYILKLVYDDGRQQQGRIIVRR